MKTVMCRLVIGLGVLLAILALTLLLGLRNMSSEYKTANAIRDLERFLRENDGRWPSSSTDLGDQYPTGGAVFVDYIMTSKRLLEDPTLLRNAVRPRSGRFATYPHYEADLERLYEVLLENQEGTS